MKLRPILFSTPMVLALLAGTKTQTRRLIKPQPDVSDGRPITLWYGWPSLANSGETHHTITPPYGKPGDVLWVRETWAFTENDIGRPVYIYRADVPFEFQQDIKWKSSLFMPKDACRLWLEITNIRVERLQAISEQDAIAEGVASCPVTDGKGNDSIRYQDYGQRFDISHPMHKWCHSAKTSYHSLWETINGRESWEQNPYVWVIEFKRIEKPVLL